MGEAVVGWLGLTVLVLACALTLATDVARQCVAGRATSPPVRRLGAPLLAATTVFVAARLAVTIVRVLVLF